MDMIYETICPFCGKVSEISIDFDKFMEWKEGKKVQDAFPELSPSERELLITGMCSECQKKVFGF